VRAHWGHSGEEHTSKCAKLNMSGDSDLHDVEANGSLLVAVGTPIHGQSDKPTAIFGPPVTDGAKIHLRVVMKKDEMRFGVVARSEYLALPATGTGRQSWFASSGSTKGCTSFLCCRASNHSLQHGSATVGKTVPGTISAQQVLTMEYQGPATSASGSPTLVFDYDGARRILSGVPDAADLCFAVQYHNTGDSVQILGPPGIAPEPAGRALSFTRCSDELAPSTTDVLNDTVTKTSGNLFVDDNKGAGCSEYVMRTGQHYAEFKMLKLHKDRVFCMVGRPTADVEVGFSNDVWGVLKTGRYVHAELGSMGGPSKYAQDWPPGQDQGRKDAIAPGHKTTVFVQGDRLGMLVDCDRGVLAIYKNGALLGIATRELPSNEPLCFGIGLRAKGDSVQILTPGMPAVLPAVLPNSLRGTLAGMVEPEPEPEPAQQSQAAAEPLPGAVPQDEEGEPPHTFATSNFKRAYDQAGVVPITMASQIIGEIPKFVHTYCSVHGLTEPLHQVAAKAFVMKLSQEAGTHPDGGASDLLAEVQHTAELLWTSASTFEGMGDHDKEFCSLLNAAIREDLPALAQPAAGLTRGINAMCLEGRSGAALSFPPGGTTYRGGGFNNEHTGFFTEGKAFRQPAFIATSFLRSEAEFFQRRAQAAGFQGILWSIHVNPAGEQDVTKRCKHVNFVQHSLVVDAAGNPAEHEYLFTAYSVFTVRSVTWGVGGAPHHIELDAASDNAVAAEGVGGRWATPTGSEHLPLAPWS
jgi:hypothetical protein